MTQTDDRPVTVLVVEDEDDQRQLVTVYLTRSGCTVLAADNAETALARIEGVALDLAVVDLRLPGMSGWSLVDELQQRRPQVPIVVTSVLDAENYPAAHTKLPKPFNNTQLRAVLSELVPRWSPR